MERTMDGKKQGAPSSITADLFGPKESPQSPSSGIFASIFPPPATVLGRKTSSSEVIGSWQKQSSRNQARSSKQGTDAMKTQATSYSMHNNDRNSIFQEERVEPCHLSSSLYYGGQDNYSESPYTQTAGSNPNCKKDGGEDPNENNSQGASRGNWWQGSLYY